MNSKIEEISDPCHPNLLKMPVVVMKDVLKNLDFRSIFRLRKVCRVLRFSIDKINPELHLTDMRFELPLTASSIESYLEGMDESSKEFYMKRRTPRNGCTIGWQQKDIYKSAEISMEDVEILLKNTKLDYLSIELLFSIGNAAKYIRKKEEDLKKYYESLKSLLVNNRGHLLQTKEITLIAHNPSEVAGLLKCIDPKSLKSISIQIRNWNAPEAIEMSFSELEALKQWENAETLDISGNYILTPVDSFASFKTVSIHCKTVSMEKLNEVKEFFIRSPKMKTFTIRSYGNHEMKDQILSNFGEFDSHDVVFEDEVSLRPMIPWEERSFRRLKESTWKWIKNVSGST